MSIIPDSQTAQKTYNEMVTNSFNAEGKVMVAKKKKGTAAKSKKRR